MKITLIVIIGIIVISLIVCAVGRGTDNVANGAIQGVVTSVDTEQAMFDGPYVVIIQTDAGTQETIHVPLDPSAPLWRNSRTLGSSGSMPMVRHSGFLFSF